MKAKVLFFGLLFAVFCLVYSGHAEVPQMINYQGTLTDTLGNPIDGEYDMTFSIYDAESGGTQLWTETQTGVLVEDGIFSVLMGSVDLIPGLDTVFDGSTRYLEVIVGSDTMTPRRPLVSVGNAFRSGFASVAEYAQNSEPDDDWGISGNNIYREEGNVGIGTAEPNEKLHVQGGDVLFKDLSNLLLKLESSYQEDTWLMYRTEGADRWSVGLREFDNSLRFTPGYYTNSPSMIINANGNIGIGTSPAQKLDVAGTTQMTGFKMSTGASSGYVLTSDSLGTGTWQAAAGGADGDWAISGNNIYSAVSGNVGIGTTSPTQKLGVAGHIALEGSGPSTSHALDFCDIDGTEWQLQYYQGGLNFWESGSGSRLLIQDGGAVGIGTTNPDPDYRLHISRDANHYAKFASGGDGIGVVGRGNNTGVWGTGSKGVYGYGAWGYGEEPYEDALGVKGVGSRWGVVGSSQGATPGIGAGILGLSAGNAYAGWFKGDVYAEGNLGIGTSSPTERLDVAGTVRMTGFSMPTGASSGYVLVTDSSGLGSWAPPAGGADNDWIISGNNMYAAVSGNVGIGTSTPVGANKLYVVGPGVFLDNSFPLSLGTEDGNSDTRLNFCDGSVREWFIRRAEGDNSLRFEEKDVGDHVTIKEGGNVGIGTTSPTQKLGVAGHIALEGSGPSTSHALDFCDIDGSEWQLQYYQGGLHFWETGSGSRLFIQDGGNVGIGTTSPSTKLTVLGPSGATTDRLFQLLKDGGYGGTAFYQYYVTSQDFGLIVGQDNTDYTMRMNVDPGNQRTDFKGNVGIGTTSPAEKLDVAGTVRMAGFKMPTGAASGYVMTSDASGVGTWAAGGGGADNDWIISGNNMYSAVSGNVGIGTTNPQSLLDIQKVGSGIPGAPESR